LRLVKLFILLIRTTIEVVLICYVILPLSSHKIDQDGQLSYLGLIESLLALWIFLHYYLLINS